jgi:hypothetical protein
MNIFRELLNPIGCVAKYIEAYTKNASVQSAVECIDLDGCTGFIINCPDELMFRP